MSDSSLSVPDALYAGYTPAQALGIQRALAYARRQRALPDPGPDPLAVARILHDLCAEPLTLQAALLTDAGLDETELRDGFGERVATWVAQVNRLENLACPQEHLDDPRQAEMWRRLLLAVANSLTIHHRIAIHRRDCPNIANLPPERGRLVEASWE